MSDSPPYVDLGTLGTTVVALLAELQARTEATALLRRFGVRPGPDPVQQMIDLAHDVAELVGA
jgi:hypothetical protein